MTFNEQIEGVPMKLVRQGWRLRPIGYTPIEQWLNADPLYRWHGDKLKSGLWVYRPMQVVAQCDGGPILAYAHAGWGDGLAPSPEIIKVWSFWWISMGDGTKPVTVTFHDGAMIVDGVNSRYLGMHKWLGPVLPPVMP